MNTKGMKFLAVLAVLAMAFAGFAIINSEGDSDASAISITGEEFLAGKTGCVSKTVLSSGDYSGYTELKVLTDLNLTSQVSITSGNYIITSAANGSDVFTVSANVTWSGAMISISNAVVVFNGPNFTASKDSVTDNSAKVIKVTNNTNSTAAADTPDLTIIKGIFKDEREPTTLAKYQPAVHVTGYATFLMTGGTILGVGGTHEAPASEIKYNSNLSAGTKGENYYLNFADLFIGSQTYATISGGNISSIFSNYNSYGTEYAYLNLEGKLTIGSAWFEYDGGAKKNWVTVDGEVTFTNEVVVCAALSGDVIDTSKQTELKIDGKMIIPDSCKVINNGVMTVKGTVSNNGIVINNGSVNVSATTATVGTTGLTGLGTVIVNKNSTMTIASSQNIKATDGKNYDIQTNTNTLMIMNGGTFSSSVGNMVGAAGAIVFTSTTGTGYILATYNGSAAVSTWDGYTYSVCDDVTVNADFTIYGDDVVVGEDCTMTINAAITIPAGVDLVVSKKAVLSTGTNIVTNAGTITVLAGGIISGTIPTGTGKIVNENNTEVETKTADTTNTVEKIVDEAEQDVIVTVPSGAEVKDVTVQSNDVTLVAANATATLSDIDITVVSTTDSSKALTISGFDSVSGTITTSDGTDSQSMTLTAFTGTMVVTRGSIDMDVDASWTGLVLEDGAVLKLSGSIGTAAISVEANGKATVIIGDLSIATSLSIAKDVEVIIDGTVDNDGAFSVTAALIINGELDGPAATSGAVKVYGTVSGTITQSNATYDKTITIYSGADVSAMTLAEGTKKWIIEGSDGNGGTWTYKDAKLTLSSYNGTYVFDFTYGAGPISQLATEIILSGDSKITYAPESIAAGTVLFGKATGSIFEAITTIQDTGSLTIEVDLSEVDSADLDNIMYVIYGKAAKFSVDEVEVKIVVTGAGIAWDADEVELAAIYGIKGTTVEIYNSEVTLNIFSTYEAKNVVAIDSTTLEVKNSSLDISSAGKGIVSPTTTIKSSYVNSTANVLGAVVGTKLSITNASIVSMPSGLEAGAVDVSQESVFTVNDLVLSGKLENNATVTVSGNSSVAKTGEIDNLATFTNTGIIDVQGMITNEGGVFTNEGTATVYGYYVNETTTASVTIPHDTTGITEDSYARVNIITLTSTEKQADGSLLIKAATVTFKKYDGSAITDVTDYDKFKGTLVASQIDASYVLTLSNGTASISLSFDASKSSAALGTGYKIVVSGSIVSGTTSYSLVANSGTGNVSPDTIDDLRINTGIPGVAVAFVVSAGTFDNKGTVVLYNGNAPVGTNGTFKGDLITYTATTSVGGKFTGDLTANGTGLATISATFVGDITSAGSVTVAGTFKGDITAKDVVTVNVKKAMTGNIIASGDVNINGKLVGNVTLNNSEAVKKLTITGSDAEAVSGIMDGTLTYLTKYKSTTTATEADTEFSVAMDIDAKVIGLTITTVLGADATSSKAVYGGVLSITAASAVKEDETATLTLTDGELYFPVNVTIPSGYAVVIEDGTIVEVLKTATVTIEGAMKVSAGATKNYELVKIPTTYGKLVYVMSFDIAAGYTIYSSVTYALSNCDEGSELTVGTSTAVDQTVSVKAGVNIIVDSVTLDFDKYGLTMDDGAKITIVGSGKVIFGETDKYTDEEGIFTYYYINGTIVFDDEANVLTFENVRFDAESTIIGTAATSTAESKLTVALEYSQGIVTLEKGIDAGTITLNHDSYKVQTADEDVTLFSATYVISEETISEAFIVDAALEMVGDDITALATLVTVNGIMNVSKTTTIVGCYAGAGELIIADSISVNVKDSAVIATTFGNGIDGFGILADDSEYTITSFAATTSAAAYVQLKGTTTGTLVGGFQAIGNVSVYQVTLAGYDEDEDTNGVLIVPEGATLTVQNVKISEPRPYCLDAQGLLCVAGTLNFNDGTATTYGKINYDVNYESEGYTVYTVLETATVLAPEGTEISLEKNYNVAVSLIIPAGITVTVADGYYMILADNAYVVLGDPITSLAGTGVLTGEIILGDHAYVIDYAGSGSDIIVYDDDVDTLAVSTEFLVLDSLYATVYYGTYALDPVVYGDLNAKYLKPTIVGFYFNKWYQQNGEVVIGTTELDDGPFVAGTVASKVSVTFTTFTGINYYVDGVIVNILDAPVKVDYGATITAKITDTTAYQGTPLVNGQAYILVDDTTKTVTASGVTPIPEPQPEPQPEPEVGGISLTDILLIVLVILIAVMVVILVLRLNRS